MIEIYQRRPAYVEMILWNGSADSFYEIRDWVGISPDIGGPGFRPDRNTAAGTQKEDPNVHRQDPRRRRGGRDPRTGAASLGTSTTRIE